MKFIDEINKAKIPILLGAVLGGLSGYLAITQGWVTQNEALMSIGLIDFLVSTTKSNLATIKIIAAGVVIGATAGYVGARWRK